MAGTSPYGVRVEPAGLIFAALVVVWLAYLVPWFTTRDHDEPADHADPDGPFTESMTMVRRSADWDAQNPEIDVSTPFTRRAALRELRQAARLATSRRRRLLVGLLVIAALTAGAQPFVAWLPWWAGLVPAGLFVVSLFISRFSVRAMDRTLAARRAALQAAWENDTIAIKVPQPVNESTEVSIELSVPVPTMTGSLWDPIPVIEPSYVTKPLVPRTVRTIDLSAPVAPISVPPIAEVPVVGDAGEPGDADDRRVVGE